MLYTWSNTKCDQTFCLIVFKEKIPKSFQNLEILFTVQVSHMQYFLKMNKHEISKYKERKKKSYYFLQNSNIQK